MCDTTFAFGQRGSHFYQCPSRRDHTRLPKKLQRVLTSNQLAQVHHVTLGFENSFLVTYRDKSGRDIIESQGLPQELNDFLYATNPQKQPIRNIPEIRLTLGPYNSSFFVGDGTSNLWMNLPSPLLKGLQSRIQSGTWIDKPRIVALGTDQNFLLITEKHAAVWDLSHYRTLSQMLGFSRTQDRGIEEVHNVVLHPYRYQGFVAQSRNSTLLYENLSDWSMRGMEGMRGPILRDTREWEVRKRQADLQRRPSLRESDSKGGKNLQEWARLRGQFNDRKGDFERKSSAKGLKVSLSLSISGGGISLGKMLG